MIKENKEKPYVVFIKMVVGAKIQQIASTNIRSLGTTTWLAVCFRLYGKRCREAHGTHQTCAVIPAEILLSCRGEEAF